MNKTSDSAAQDARNAGNPAAPGARSDVHASSRMDTSKEVNPADWPGPGPIDLKLHDLPHASATLEWWYANSHVVTKSGRKLSVHASFFRQVKGKDEQTGAPEYAHSLTWSVSDADRKTYTHISCVDPNAPQEGMKRLRKGLGARDPRVNRALGEILARGNVPLPDRLIKGNVFVSLDRLDLDYGGATFRKLEDGSYALHLFDDRTHSGVDFVFKPLKPPVRHGDDGVVRGPDNERMFYIFQPRCEVTGTIIVDGVRQELAQGQGWYDHEFGRKPVEEDEPDFSLTDPAKIEAEQDLWRTKKEDNAIGWTWLSLQLDDGTEITLYPLVWMKDKSPAGAWAVIVDAKGNRTVHHDFKLEPLEWWQSSATFLEYPVKWKAEIPQAGIELDVKAAFEDQEVMTIIAKTSFYEGRVDVEGKVRGKPLKGVGFVECSSVESFEDLDNYFRAVGKVVKKSIRDLVPLEPTFEQARDLIGTPQRDNYLDGMDLNQLGRTLMAPIREITDRGGKSWRSYAAVTCCDIVGGDSRKFIQWLALPEMMHVGSLIVDDVQDKSVVRRGGPAVHHIYGEAQAINAGTAAYFLGWHLVDFSSLTDRDKVRVNNLFLEALRAGHAGQALDLDGFGTVVDDVVETGNAALLEKRVLAVHRLKTAAPAACLARMGAIAGGGSEAQIEALGGFFENLGMAFQIVDDVLNLRGFKGDLKARGEDISMGKVTYPVAKALSRFGLEDRRKLIADIRKKPQDQVEIDRIVEVLESVGAIEVCVVESQDLIEKGWARLDPLVEDTFAKLILRSFGWFVLERHY